jgi:hypothetical protein
MGSAVAYISVLFFDINNAMLLDLLMLILLVKIIPFFLILICSIASTSANSFIPFLNVLRRLLKAAPDQRFARQVCMCADIGD